MLGATGSRPYRPGTPKTLSPRVALQHPRSFPPAAAHRPARHSRPVVTPILWCTPPACRTPCIILTDLVPRGYPGDIHLPFNSVSLKTIHHSIAGILKK